MSNVEVAVVGRGLIGSAAARRLAEAGHSVALIGPGEPEDCALATVADWFRSGGRQAEADDLEARLREFLPRRTILSKDIKRCVVTNTPHELPWIDWVDDRVAVAVGGCGSAAKSADEIGRLAGTLFTEEGWTDPVLKLESFRPAPAG